jgi:hypothetical protein
MEPRLPLCISQDMASTLKNGRDSIMSISDFNKQLLNRMNSTASRVQLGELVGDATLVAYTSAAGAGGAATEAMTLTGLAAGDAIVSVSQKTPGADDLPLLGWTTQADNALTCVWSADPGAGAVVVVLVRKA